jgi:hypothetical protein
MVPVFQLSGRVQPESAIGKGGQRERVFQALIDRSRAPLDLDTIQTILGYRRRPRYRTRKRKSAQLEVAIEKPTYDLTIFRLHWGS